MAYRSMMACLLDLEKQGELLRVKEPVDPQLEMAEIHRRIFEQKGPAILFEKVKGSPFPAVSNIYGTFERTDYLFRKTMPAVQKVVELKADPSRFFQNPLRYLSAPFTALSALPMRSIGRAAITFGQTTVDQLPQVVSWPMDGGAFITLPQVFSQPPGEKKAMRSNIGMYRIQLSGNQYLPQQEIGLHYQIHRGIGVHHSQYNRSEEAFRVSILVGGPPSHAFAAIMPLPEGLSELTFAGMLAGRRFRYTRRNGFFLSSDADFVITGIIRKQDKKPEGPFGDHLGYYSLKHGFPVMEVERVYHRRDAVWHFTVVGRPPQEDSSFGYLIHQIVKELTPGEFPGIKSINAVDAAGVHPLLLAVGSERYMPFREAENSVEFERRKGPEEILTQASRILGSGQTSLAKYLWITTNDDQPELTAHQIPAFFQYMLQRIDWTRDLHFFTKTTMDTLDYSGSSWNTGSKVIIAAHGRVKRQLGTRIPDGLSLPDGFTNPRLALPGILILQAPSFTGMDSRREMERLQLELQGISQEEFPLIIVADDATFTAATLNNFLWVSFTRSNPSQDIYGVDAFTENKHWGCRGSILIDARIKPHHAPVLEPDPKVVELVDRRFRKGGELYKWKK